MAASPTPTLMPSAVYAATNNSGPIKNRNSRWKGVIVSVDVTLDAAAASVLFAIQGRDPTSGTWTTILVSAAVADVGFTQYTIYPGLTAVANVTASANLPHDWRVLATHTDGDDITYSVGANYLV